MTTIHITRESHADPDKYRIKHKDAMRVLGPDAHIPKSNDKPVITSESAVSIIGAGFAGLCTALMCKKKFDLDDFVVFEKHMQWGGTWWANSYPGCASDIPAFWYSIFDELNDNWSALRPPQYEMEEYILGVVKKHDLDRHAKFGIVASKVVYDEEHENWKIYATSLETGQRYEHTSKVVFACQGGLVQPAQLQAPGLENYKGVYMHSAVWDHSVDFKDKQVVVVGNGCSAAQVVPALVNQLEVKKVTQVFRSKHWIMPPIPPFIFYLYKLASFTRLGMVLVRLWLASLAEIRYPLYRGNSLVSRFMRWSNTAVCRRYVHKFAPEKYHRMLLPDYKIGCKRLVFDYIYVPTLNNPRVELTDKQIDHVEEHGLVLKDGTRVEADIIVACTGYDIRKSFYDAISIVGRGGMNVQDLWRKEGVSAYRTCMVRDCPNFFFISGPNSATGHSSIITAIDNGCAFASRAVKPVLTGEASTVTVKRSAYYNWFESTQEKLLQGVYGSGFGGCTSWYTMSGTNSTTYPASQTSYWYQARKDHLNDMVYEPVKAKKD